MTRTLSELWETAADRTPGATALVFDDTPVPFGELRARVDHLAEQLRSKGFGRGSLIGLCMSNTPDLVVTLLAIWRIDGVVVELNPSVPEGARAEAARQVGAVTLIGEDSLAAGSLLDIPRFDEETVRSDPGLACINMTSGTSGPPKNVMLSHENLVRNAELYIRYFELTRDDRTCLVLPLYFGMNKIALLAHLALGATVLLEASASIPNRTLATMEAHGATGLCAVPASIRSILSRGDLSRFPVRTLRYVRIGAGRVPRPLMDELRSAFPTTEIYLTYGLTEMGLVAVLSDSEFDRRPDSCGRVIEEVDVTVTPSGEIVVRCDHAASGYWRDPARTAAVFLSEGLHTGDLGRLDADGYLYLTGRQKEMIKSGGENISSEWVEQVILRHEAVADCAVVGVPDDWLGEAIIAVVVPEPGRALDERELQRHCKDELPPIARPKRFILRDEIPRNETGKIMRAELLW